MSDHEILLKLLEEVQAARADIKRIDAKVEGLDAKVEGMDKKMDRRFDETVNVVHEVAETMIDTLTTEIREVKNVTAANCYDIATLKRRA